MVREMALMATFLLHLFLMFTLQIQGSSAVTDVFGKTGGELILNLTKAEIPPDSRIWIWQFTDQTMVEFIIGSKPTIGNSHAGRIDILEKTYSVKLKNLTKSDSGIYTAKIISPKEQILTQYNVTVQDPVSPVEITFTCKSRTSSFSILTVTCRADDSSISITLRCQNQTCNQEEGENMGVTRSGAPLHIYKLNESIVCNHSNQVSRDESIKKIEDHCIQRGEPRHHYWYIWVILVVLLLSIIYIVCRRCKKADDKENVDNTIYALPVVTDKNEKLNQTSEDEACSPTTTYSTVGPSISKEPTKTGGNCQPESVYSMIERPSK